MIILRPMRKDKSLTLLFIFLVINLITQSGCKSNAHKSFGKAKHQNRLEDYPYWIAMMNDPHVNYYEAVEAFEKYWEHREKPTEDDGEGKDIHSKEKSKEETEKEAKRTVEYVYEYKQFLNWQQRNKNLVKPDGTIMTPEEVIEQWKKSNPDTLQR